MGFDDILKRRLGPLRALVGPRGSDVAPIDANAAFYRRAAGIEIRLRLDPGAPIAELRGPREETPPLRLPLRRALALIGLTRWTAAAELEAAHGISAEDALQLVERDLLYYAPVDPKAPLAGAGGVLEAAAGTRRIARRRSVWPTLAIETPIQIGPLPFMPRGADLQGAELVGMRFACLERGHEVLGANLFGSAEIGARLRRLLPLLDGTRTEQEIVAGDDAMSRMLELLDGLTLLELAPDARPLFEALRAPKEPQVTWLGHAGVLLQTAAKSVLVDPLFFSESDPPEPHAWPRFDPRALPPIDAILITHGDNDHLNTNSLAQLDPAIPIVIPAMAAVPAPYQVDLRGLLRLLGQRRVIELVEWQRQDLGAGLSVTACPFRGEDWGLPLAQLTYLIEADGLAVYLSADAFQMDEVYQRLSERRIDLALMGISGSAEAMAMPPELGYGNFYEPWIPKERRNLWVQHSAGPADAAKNVAIMKPRFAFGYAAGGAPYIKTAYSDTGDHRSFAEAVRSTPGAVSTPVALPLGQPVLISQLGRLS